MRGKSIASARLEKLAKQIRVCTECPLHESRQMAVPGDGELSARIMLIGEAPGKDEDASGHPFVGSSGRFLNKMLEEVGIDRKTLFITNIVKCRPPANRTPRAEEVATCTSDYLDAQIALINPEVIMLLGGVAAKRLLGLARIDDARGRILEHEGRKYIVSYHPAVRFYREDLAEKMREDFRLLKQAISESKPRSQRRRVSDKVNDKPPSRTQPGKQRVARQFAEGGPAKS
jgi:uracil-DNA glycosylase